MCKTTQAGRDCPADRTRPVKLLRLEKRSYSNFPPELASFWVGDKRKPFKKENLRQSLARATQTLKLAAEGQKKCVFKHGRLQPYQYENEKVLTTVRHILSNTQQDIDSFTFPKTCLRLETRRPAKYRAKDRSWNSQKWEEFRNIAGIRYLLGIVLDLLFESWNLEKVCGVWEKTCCPDGLHKDPRKCEARWRALREFCLKDCGLESGDGMETDETDEAESLQESFVLFDPYEVLVNPSC